MKPLKLPNGVRYGYGNNGERICLGAMMGRSNKLPEDPKARLKLRLVRLRWVDSCYDQGGAYWGCGAPIYWATDGGDGEPFTTDVFVRAKSRANAKEQVRQLVPLARFYR